MALSSTLSRLNLLPRPSLPYALSTLGARKLRPVWTPLVSPSNSSTYFSISRSSPKLNSEIPGAADGDLIVLGIETSCDDTAAAVVRSSGEILSQVVSSQADLLVRYGGVAPKMAEEAHSQVIDQVVQEALDKANVTGVDLSAVAVTIGPGLSLCLRVGVQKARKIAGSFNLPMVGVHHMEAHALVARLIERKLQFPFMALLISGGHNLLILAQELGQYIQLGTTIDDAIGEAYDKTAKWLGLDMRRSGGPAIEQLARDGDAESITFSIPMRQHKDCNFSYAGLKTQVRLAIESRNINAEIPISQASDQDRSSRADIAASFQRVAVLHLEERCERAIEWALNIEPSIKHLVVSGGVASNQYVRARLDQVVKRKSLQLVCPPPSLCTDNGVMVAWTGIEHFCMGRFDPTPLLLSLSLLLAFSLFALCKMGIFEPYRAIGYITSTVPFSVQRLGTETFVTVSVGKAFQVYNRHKLTLILVSPQLPKKIRALASYREYTFAAYGNEIAVFKRAHLVATWGRHNAKVDLLLLFGDHILSVDIEGNMFIWPFKGVDQNSSPVGHVTLDDNFTPSCMVHPDTYLNKVLLGSREGSLQLWNISTKKKIYEFKGWNSPISSCVSSPALDVIAVGCADGKIHVHNIRYDEELVTFTHSTRGAVTALSFSTDGQPLLGSGGSSGVISIWNLEKRRLQSVIRDAHDSSIISLHFLANEPILMSSSADNSIKMWKFNTTDGDPELHSFRSGHSAPPLCIRFYANGRHILSAGQDRAFRLFSVIQDQQSKELSQRHISKRAKKLRVKEEEIKLKPVIAFDCAEIRERDWCNVVTCHMDTAQAYVWRLQNFVLGEHILAPCPENVTPVKACAITACGNFAVLGTAGGWIERFNLQSGISRGTYLDKSERRSCAHNGEVVGVACDSTNTLMISAGYRGDIKVWDFKGRELKSRWEIPNFIVKIVYHRPNGLLAVVADDFIIRLFDVVASRVVRKFEGHTDRITDLCFSEDGKWLLSSSMDGSLRIWDVILARQIDAMQVDGSVTALSLSPNMDFLATTHVDQNGVYLWVNQSMFSGASNVDSYASGKEVVSVKLPPLSSTGSSQPEDSDEPMVKHLQSKDASAFSSQDQQIPDLVTLSLLPKSQWQSLINLDIIKLRNKPIEPPKKPEKAPFFLPSAPSLSGEILFKPSKTTDEEKGPKSDEVEDKRELEQSSQFLQLLQSTSEMKNFSAFTDYIKGLSPSTLDMELRMLQIIDDDDQQEPDKRPESLSIELLLDYFVHEISCRNNFEFIQAVIRLFLKIHGETIRRQSRLQDKARKLLEIQCAVWQKVDKLFQSARCMVTFLSNSQF